MRKYIFETYMYMPAARGDPARAQTPYTSSLRPHTLVAQGLIHWYLKTAYTSSLRPHPKVAQGLIH
jgi:hypothetical protein